MELLAEAADEPTFEAFGAERAVAVLAGAMSGKFPPIGIGADADVDAAPIVDDEFSSVDARYGSGPAWPNGLFVVGSGAAMGEFVAGGAAFPGAGPKTRPRPRAIL